MIKNTLFTLLFILVTLTTKAQIASRLLSTQSTLQGISPDNVMFIDVAGGVQRIYVARTDSMKFATKQILGIRDTITNMGLRSFYTKTQGDLRYLQSFTELDPTVPSFVKGITLTNISQWNSAYSVASNLATVATTGSYVDLLSKPTIPTTTSQLTNNSGFLTSVPAQSFSSITGKPTTLSGYGIVDAYPLSGNPSAFLTSISSGQVTTALGYTPLSAEVDGSITNEIELPMQTGQSGKVLSTNGTSPSWVNSPTGTVSSVGLISSDLTVSGSPITTSGSITANLTTTGVSAGTYDWVTVDTKGRISTGINTPLPTIIASGGRNFNQAYQISSTRPSQISISAQISCNLSLTGGQAGTIQMQISADGSTNWLTIGTITASSTGTLTIGLNTTQISGSQLVYNELPTGYYWRATTTNTTGTPTFTFNGGYQVVY